MVTIGGAAFLFAYAAIAFRRALKPQAMKAAATGRAGLWAAVSACLAFTFLNPHVYLDTVVLLGSVSTRYEGHALQFALGAMTASFVFFFALGYGAALLRPMFARPRSWQVLDVIIAVIMFAIAAKLLIG